MDIKKYEKNNKKLAGIVQNLKIVSSEEYAKGADLRAVIKTRYKKIDEARKMMTEPHRKKTAEINALFKEQLEPLNDLLKQLDHGMLSFKKVEAAKVATKMLQAQKEAAKQGKKAEPVVAPERKVKTEKGTTSLKKVWKGRIVNPQLAFSKYPDLFIPNDKKVNEMARFIQSEQVVDGVEIYFEEVLSTRT